VLSQNKMPTVWFLSEAVANRKQFFQELQLAVNQMRDLQRECCDHNLEREHEQLRLQCEERMAEAAQAFNNAETDRVKRLKQKLAQEKSKRKTLHKVIC